jgi:hypothetical protein
MGGVLGSASPLGACVGVIGACVCAVDALFFFAVCGVRAGPRFRVGQVLIGL